MEPRTPESAQGFQSLSGEFSLSQGQTKKLEEFGGLVAAEAAGLGLVGFEPGQLVSEIVRSLLFLRILGSRDSLSDVGSGAGFPGIPLAIARPRTRIVLIEPRRRAASFLERVARELGLTVEVVARPAEEAALGDLRESFDCTISRGLARFPVALELCSPLCRVGGILAMTGNPGIEVSIPLGAQRELGVEAPTSRSEHWHDIPQVFHIVKKVARAGKAYPRRVGAARSRPLF